LTRSHAGEGRAPEGFLRRFDAGRDVPEIVALLELAFGADLEARDRQWLDELSRLSDLAGPWLGMLTRALPPLSASLSGYVWEIDGRVAANASFLRAADDVWVVANVVTQPEWRNQGIATRMMEAIIATARRGGGREVQLQVRDDNDAARRLYLRLGFRSTGSTTWLLGPAGAHPPPSAAAADGCAMVRWGWRDRRRVRQLVMRADPDGYGVPRIVHDSVHGGLGQILGDWFGEESRFRPATSCGGAITGVGVARTSRPPGPHQVAIVVDPSWRGRVESLLVAALLDALRPADGLSIQAEIDARETGAIGALEAAGFNRQRTLDRMVLRLR
jgi:ribosomal protein S18 acetylase RimI-like enzyme